MPPDRASVSATRRACVPTRPSASTKNGASTSDRITGQPAVYPTDARLPFRAIVRITEQCSAPLVLLEALPEGYFLKGHLPTARNLPHDRVRQLAPLEVSP